MDAGSLTVKGLKETTSGFKSARLMASVNDAPAAKPLEGWDLREAKRAEDGEGANEEQAAAAAAAEETQTTDDACFVFLFLFFAFLVSCEFKITRLLRYIREFVQGSARRRGQTRESESAERENERTKEVTRLFCSELIGSELIRNCDTAHPSRFSRALF